MRLPKKVTISIDELLEKEYLDVDTELDEDYIADAVSDYLSDTYGFCHYGFNIDEVNMGRKVIKVTDIKWDTSD